MHALEILYWLILGLSLGVFVMYYLCQRWVVQPMRKEVITVLRDNCDVLRAVTTSLERINEPACDIEPYDEDEDDTTYLPDAVEQDLPPAGQLVPVVPESIITQYNFAGNTTSYEVRPREQQ